MTTTLDDLSATLPNGFDAAGGERIDIGPLTELSNKSSLKLPPVPDGAFANWVFLTEWNAFIYVAAREATLKWLGERTVRTYENTLVAVSQIKFAIKEATTYYSEGDEDRFFKCFYYLPEYVDVRWDGANLQLTLNTPISLASFKELVALFALYGVPFSFLGAALPALSTEGRSYFANSDAYWFTELYPENTPPPPA